MIGHLVTHTNQTAEQLLELLEGGALERISFLNTLPGGLDITVTDTGSFDLSTYVDEGQEALEFIAEKVAEWKEPLAALKAFLTMVDLAGDTMLAAGEAVAGVNNITGSQAVNTDALRSMTEPIQDSREHLTRVYVALPDPEDIDRFRNNLLRLSAGLEKLKALG